MEMMKIDHLPSEILLKIFSYLPSYKDVSLVNKRFYDVACCANDSNLSVSFCSIFLENGYDQSVLDSIQSTQRKVSKLSISFGYRTQTLIRKSAIADAMKIVKKFSATIKYLRLECISLKMYDFLEILSFLPNAEHLNFTRVYVKELNQTLSNEECLKLHRLKTLELSLCSKKFLVVFNRLPAGVLKNLTIAYWKLNLNLLNGLFALQSNITDLVLVDEDDDGSGSTLPEHIFDHSKLKSLKFYQYQSYQYKSRLSTILSKQTELLSLSLRGGEADERILNVITNQLSKLEKLEINVGEEMVVPFKKIVKLKKLKELNLQSCTLKVIETFAGLDNSRITTLIMNKVYTEFDDDDRFAPMPINVISALANSLPNLKVLQFDHHCECPAIDAIMQHFNYIEVLETKFGYDVDANHLIETIKVDRCFNPKLTELTITKKFLCEEALLTKLIAMYPNLKKLYLSPDSITMSQFMVILNGFKKMESLTLSTGYDSKLTTEFLDYIEDHKNSLKSLTLGHFNFDQLPAEHQKKLKGVFDVIEYKFHKLYMGYKKSVKST